jgi:hypothetical protein
MNSPAIMHMASKDSGEPARSERPSLERPRTPSPTAQSNLPSSDSAAPAADDSSKAGDFKSSPTDSGYRSGGSDTTADLKRQRTSYDHKAIIACLDKLRKGVLPPPTPPRSKYLNCWHREFLVPVRAWLQLRETIFDTTRGWWLELPGIKPRVEYNAYTEILTLRMPAGIHESVIDQTKLLIVDKFKALSSDASLPEHVRASIKGVKPSGSPDTHLDRSKKVPDFAFRHPAPGPVTFVAEVAYSQPTTEDSVGLIAEQYLGDSVHVNTVLYFDIKYRTPKDREDNTGIPQPTTYQVFRVGFEDGEEQVVSDGPQLFWNEDGIVNPTASLILYLNDFLRRDSQVEADYNAKIEIPHKELAAAIEMAELNQEEDDQSKGSKPGRPNMKRRFKQRCISVENGAEVDTEYDPAREGNATPQDDSSQEDAASKGEPLPKRLRLTSPRKEANQRALQGAD